MRIAAAILVITSGLYADSQGNGKACSDATLNGGYGFTIAGTRPSGPPPGPIEQFVGLAITHFDGQGGLTQPYGTSHGSMSGDSTTDTGSGTYTLNADCSGIMTLNITGRATPVSLRLWIIVVNGGEEIHTVVRTPAPNGILMPASNLTTSHGTKVGPPKN